MPTEAPRARGGPRVLGGIGAACAVIAAAVVVVIATRGPSAAHEKGRRLFAGELPLVGTIVGHQEPLPTDAVRCANCHEEAIAPQRSAAPAPSSEIDPARTLGTALDRATLLGAVARRGGPPSTYQAPAFCRVLREGIDPANVMIPQTMPRYSMNDADCEALWTFLTAR